MRQVRDHRSSHSPPDLRPTDPRPPRSCRPASARSGCDHNGSVTVTTLSLETDHPRAKYCTHCLTAIKKNLPERRERMGGAWSSHSKAKPKMYKSRPFLGRRFGDEVRTVTSATAVLSERPKGAVGVAASAANRGTCHGRDHRSTNPRRALDTLRASCVVFPVGMFLYYFERAINPLIENSLVSA